MGIVISPSGGFYGSEQVLLDFLGCTRGDFKVYIPADGQLAREVQGIHRKHRWIFHRWTTAGLYARVAVRLLKNRDKVVYVNEAGHIKYIRVLARLYPRRNFVVHVRINEDAAPERWKGVVAGNLKVVTISAFLQRKLPIKALLVYDPFAFTGNFEGHLREADSKFSVGVIGRVTETKGFRYLPPIVRSLHAAGRTDMVFHLFGHIDPNLTADNDIEYLRNSELVKFEGFKSTRSEIYKDLDAVLHLCPDEPLGRIYFEALNELIPLVGFHSGGIGELGEMLGLTNLLVEPDSTEPASSFIEKLDSVRRNRQALRENMMQVKELAADRFSVSAYAQSIDEILGI